MFDIKKGKYNGKPLEEMTLQGILFGVKDKIYVINKEKIINILIYNKDLGHSIAIKQVEKKWNKLISILPDLLVSDDEDGAGLREALNQIEKFRQIIKNKYRKYLYKKDLEKMSKRLLLFQKEAQNRLIELQNSKIFSSYKSSCK